MKITLVISALLIIILLNCMVAAKKESVKYRVAFLSILFGLSLWCILYTTILSRIPGSTVQSVILQPFNNLYLIWTVKWYGYGSYVFRESIANVLLFLPMGMSIQNLFSPKHRCIIAIFAGAVVSFSVECMQYQYELGTFQTDDLINNVWGTVAGTQFCYAIERFSKGIREKQVYIRAMFSVVLYGAIMIVVCGKAILG